MHRCALGSSEPVEQKMHKSCFIMTICGSVLQEKHYTFLLEQAGSRVESGRAVVQYNQFLELLRLARNRCRAFLQ